MAISVTDGITPLDYTQLAAADLVAIEVTGKKLSRTLRYPGRIVGVAAGSVTVQWRRPDRPGLTKSQFWPATRHMIGVSKAMRLYYTLKARTSGEFGGDKVTS